jgi:HK97 family phage major capsid protein
MNSNTASAVDKLKATTTGEYLWRNGMTAGAPDTLLGYPVVISEDMPDVGSNMYPIAFGNWKLFYVIVDKAGIRFLRDPYSDKPNVQFYAYRRVGGGVANSEAVKLLKIATS